MSAVQLDTARTDLQIHRNDFIWHAAVDLIQHITLSPGERIELATSSLLIGAYRAIVTIGIQRACKTFNQDGRGDRLLCYGRMFTVTPI
jgi:hypothetical protein